VRLPKSVWCIGASRIGLSKLIRKVREVLHHTALSINLFPPFSFLVISPLKIGRGAVRTGHAWHVLGQSAGTSPPTLVVKVLRVVLRVHRKGECEGKNDRNGKQYHSNHRPTLTYFSGAIETRIS